MKIIEFVGIPGSGKSTVAKIVLNERVKASSHKVISYEHVLSSRNSGWRLGLQERLRYLVYIFFNYPEFLLLVIFSFYPVKKNLEWRLFRALRVAELSRRVRKTVKHSSEVVLDQGPVQAFFSWMWAGGKVSGSTAEKIIKAIYPKDVDLIFVLIETTAAIAMERVKEREVFGEKKVLSHLSDHERLLTLERGVYCLDGFIKQLQVGDFTVIRLDGTLKPRENAALVLDVFSAP